MTLVITTFEVPPCADRRRWGSFFRFQLMEIVGKI